MEEGKTWPRRLRASGETRTRNWDQEKESWEVVTTETKREARDGGGKGGLWADMTGKQKGPVGLSLRNWDRPPEGLREKQDIPTQEEASWKEGSTRRACTGAQYGNRDPESWR